MKVDMDSVVFVMGVSGVGKSLIASSVSESIKGVMVEADDYHSEENIDAMRNAVPLNDLQRTQWLGALIAGIRASGGPNMNQPLIVSCSALKREYRNFLRNSFPDAFFVFLEAPRSLVRQRIENRQGHFMPLALLDSQFDALEPPADDEAHLVVDARMSRDAIVQRIVAELSDEELVEDLLNTEEK